MKDPLIEVQQELRARKNRTVRCIYWSPDVGEFTIIPIGDEENALGTNFNLKPGPDWDAERCADWIEYRLRPEPLVHVDFKKKINWFKRLLRKLWKKLKQ